MSLRMTCGGEIEQIQYFLRNAVNDRIGLEPKDQVRPMLADLS